MRVAAVLGALALMAAAGPATAALPLVAVDPGHGGADSGAVGVLPAGTATGLPPRTDAGGRTLIYEKDVTLDVGRRLDAWLRARGFRTVMTRTRDLAGGDRPYTGVSADLEARVRVANEAGADLFVSIHENASAAGSAAGTETFHFYYSGAAARALATSVHQEVVLRLGLPDRGVKTAGFYVLKNTAMPAVLVEGAFLTNAGEAALLARPDVRQRLAEGIGAGIVRYQQGGGVASTAYGPAPRAAPTVVRYWVTAGVFRRRADALRRAAALRRQGTRSLIRSRYSARLGRSAFFVVTSRHVSLATARRDRDRLRALRFPARVGPVLAG